MTLTVISLLEKVIYVDLENHHDYNIFAGIFVCNDNNVINRIQIADAGFKLRLEKSVNVTIEGQLLDRTKSRLNEIPTNSKFLVLRGYFDESFFLHSLKCEILKLNNSDMYLSHLLQNDDFRSLYKTFMFYCGDEKETIGIKNVYERTCRFCGKKVPEVSFTSKKAHALSEFLGNKSLVCLEECATCNSYFGETIECELSRMLSPTLSLFFIKGKRGYRKTRGKNFVLEPKKQKDGNWHYLEFKQREETPIQEVDGYKFYDASSIKYIPQDVYKCLCKYVISVIDSRYLSYFKETTNWILSPTNYRNLPLIAVDYRNEIHKTPSLTINIRNNDNFNLPYCIGTLYACNTAFAFIVPFCAKDKYTFITPRKFIKFKEIIQSGFPDTKWRFENYSYSTKQSTPYSFSLSLDDNILWSDNMFKNEASNL